MTFDPTPYSRRIKADNEAEKQKIQERSFRAMEEARRLAKLIKERDPAVKDVFLFGSLAEGFPSHIDFDIDLALDGGDVYAAMDITEESSFSVDVVELSLLSDHIRTGIQERGIRL